MIFSFHVSEAVKIFISLFYNDGIYKKHIGFVSLNIVVKFYSKKAFRLDLFLELQTCEKVLID